MSADGVDGLVVIRRRLFQLVEWFRGDVDRLRTAQARWRTAQQGIEDDELWQRRVETEVDNLLIRLESKQLAFVALSSDSSADAVLLELEAIDRAAWLWAGPTQGAPSQTFGSGDRACYVVRLGRERLPRTASQAGVVYTHLRYHAVVPKRIVLRARPAPIQVRLRMMATGFDGPLARKELGLATTSFDDGATIERNGERATTIRNGDDRGSQLWTAIQAAERDGFDVLVAPELTITPTVRQRIAQQLRWRVDMPGDVAAVNRLALLVPGTFHEQIGARFVHRALVLDRAGNAVLEHHKLVSFGTLADFMEDIDLGDVVTLLITPIGTVAIAICKDFCDDHVGAIWHQIQPEWLLVPAFGKGENAHADAAARIGRMVGTVTVLAHQGDAAQNAPFKSFIHDAERPFDTNCSAPHFMGCKISISKTS